MTYITTAIAYPNGTPHLGHAYEYVLADFMARAAALRGNEVALVTGTDEHGQKIKDTAEREGLSPQELVDRNAAVFRDLHARLGVEYTRFVRTTEPDHVRAATELWNRLAAAGDVYRGNYAGWYSVRDERFVTEKETRLEHDGTRVVADTGTPVTWKEETCWFFRLSKYAAQVRRILADGTVKLEPRARVNEVLAFLDAEDEVSDLAISRPSERGWGIPVPGDPDSVMYVWVDALTNYLTGVGFPDPSYTERWPADVHVIGKDIVRFHAVYWLAFLLSAEIALPRSIVSHGFVTVGADKLSKSAGNAADPFGIIDNLGTDAVRNFLLRSIPFGEDGAWSVDSARAAYNADLANGLGNTAQRVITLASRTFGGVPDTGYGEHASLVDDAHDTAETFLAHATRGDSHRAVTALWDFTRRIDQALSDTAPWRLIKEGMEREAGEILTAALESVRIAAVLAQCAVPVGAGQILVQLGAGPSLHTKTTAGASLTPGRGVWERAR